MLARAAGQDVEDVEGPKFWRNGKVLLGLDEDHKMVRPGMCHREAAKFGTASSLRGVKGRRAGAFDRHRSRRKGARLVGKVIVDSNFWRS